MKQLLLVVSIGALLYTTSFGAGKSPQLASFDHSRLTASSNCIRCHSRDQPDDDRHRRTQANCSTCHSTDSWSPATTESIKGAK
ncbi:MAG: hypothetical protein HGB22_06320 [Chlorobiaceae bacterium]|nr:hypothetical protein [Chlorobiaceae bacterium]